MSEQQKTKVRRFEHFKDDYHLTEIEDGDYVLYEDYLKCVEALKSVTTDIDRYESAHFVVDWVMRRNEAVQKLLKELGEDSECPVIKSWEKK